MNTSSEKNTPWKKIQTWNDLISGSAAIGKLMDDGFKSVKKNYERPEDQCI